MSAAEAMSSIVVRRTPCLVKHAYAAVRIRSTGSSGMLINIARDVRRAFQDLRHRVAQQGTL